MAAALAVAGAGSLVYTSHEASATRESRNLDSVELTVPAPTAASVTELLSLPDYGSARPVPETVTATTDNEQWQAVTVKRGDSLALIFARQNVSAAQLQEVLRLGDQVAHLKNLYPGETVRFKVNGDGLLEELVHEIDETHSLRVFRTGSGLAVEEIKRDLEVRIAHSAATIRDSLFLAGQEAGLSDNMIMELAAIFGWDIDFALDIRQGDHFTVVYEEHFLDGRKVRDGSILAAEFTNRGTAYRAVRYTNEAGESGYYTPEGMSVRKAFLRTPVKFSRISSRFDLKRKHPLLNRIRAHKGVDYAAPTGTPVRATGDGKVVHCGTKGGYGSTVVISHGQQYSTLYAHLSRYQKGLGVGSRVRQGQIIGYVGKSGLATGPHLHYEFRINGAHRNPLTVKLPMAEPIAPRYRQQFQEAAAPLTAQLELLTRSLLARN